MIDSNVTLKMILRLGWKKIRRSRKYNFTTSSSTTHHNIIRAVCSKSKPKSDDRKANFFTQKINIENTKEKPLPIIMNFHLANRLFAYDIKNGLNSKNNHKLQFSAQIKSNNLSNDRIGK